MAVQIKFLSFLAYIIRIYQVRIHTCMYIHRVHTHSRNKYKITDIISNLMCYIYMWPALRKPSMFAYFTLLHKNCCKVLIVQPIFWFLCTKRRKLWNFFTVIKIIIILHLIMWKLYKFKVLIKLACEHGGFLQSQSHILAMHICMYVCY